MIILESKIYRQIRRLFLDVVLNALNLIDELKLKIEYWFRTKERTEEEWEIKNEIEEEEERFYLMGIEYLTKITKRRSVYEFDCVYSASITKSKGSCRLGSELKTGFYCVDYDNISNIMTVISIN